MSYSDEVEESDRGYICRLCRGGRRVICAAFLHVLISGVVSDRSTSM